MRQMSTATTISELSEKLESLLLEKRDIEAFLAQVPDKEKRLAALRPGWHSLGEIEETKRLIRDSNFPIFIAAGNGWGRNQRVVSVDEKWIGIRMDTEDEKEVTYYSRSTGQKKGTRSEFRRIDTAKAMEVWNQHIALK